MASAALQMSECDDDAAWDGLVAASPQGTVFSSSGFLRSLGCRFRRYLIGAPGRPQALCAAIEDEAGERLLGHDYTPYLGLLFVAGAATPARQRVAEEMRLSQFALEQLTARYRTVAMALSWQYADVRPFLWHNYHESALGQFKATPRYTAVLDLDGIDAATYPEQTRACRRQELRKGAAYAVREESDVEAFLAMYALTFARQGIALAPAALALVRRITTAALEQGYGRLSSCSTEQGAAAMTLFLFDSRRAYYLFAANDPALRNSGAATRLMFENIYDAKRRGLAEFDFVGVNSPQRGDFKLSFNPELKLYFDMRCERAAA
ncbi:GNAT family N-acetyltransferase [Janthinobacterium sp.]|uniref:GNAT family N-acetyltransferase n=1 Tax=Janthinobacterium sp. TaxID=1871054 RepID=UPI00293D267D|nr:GNAT family N-acetyltransferase [Janthinobacterium sp.]